MIPNIAHVVGEFIDGLRGGKGAGMAKKSEYERKRAALVPRAVAEADLFCKSAWLTERDPAYSGAWNRAYFSAMDRLSEEAGLLPTGWKAKLG